MLLLGTFLLLIILLSRITEEIVKIPSTLSIIIYSFAISLLFPELFSISSGEFDEILYLMLPVILLPDILNISMKELKNNAKEIFYLAIIAVVGSIILAAYVAPYLLPQYSFTIGMLIALFSMLMATDAITVASIMSKFKLPEKLKIYAESESLFNDVTALVIFYFIALPLISGGDVTILSINYILFKVLIFSTMIGVVVAYLGFLSIKILRNPLDQFIIIYLVVIVSFLIAEHFHIAGILSIVASALTFKYFVQKETIHESERRIKNDNAKKMKDKYSILELIKSVPAITKREFREYRKEAIFIGVFANAVVFIIIANIIELSLLSTYIYEILVVFAITTIIRFMSVFLLITKMKLPFRWVKALTLSGSKGALAIIMVHSIPQNFLYKDMFEAVVIGNVLISTFLYTVLLMFHIKLNKSGYELDLQVDMNNMETNMLEYTKNLVNVLEKDTLTQAYNRQFIEDILSKELGRSSRYNLDLSLLIFKLPDRNKMLSSDFETMGNIISLSIRLNDYFGKLDDGEYIIVATNTSLGGAVVLAEKIYKEFNLKTNTANIAECYFAVAQANETDDVKTILEKLYDALSRSLQNKSHQIEIEA